MSTLFPRLLPDAASDLWRSFRADGPAPPPKGGSPSLARSVFAATGGQRITPDRLTGVRVELLKLAEEAGMPFQITDRGRTEFDISVARYLHSSLDLSSGEASQRQIWSYFGLVLAPDICAWRYPPSPTRGFFEERFRCADVTRHTLSRLWLRAHLLFDADAADPYYLVGVLGENDMDQIITRREDIAASPTLVRAIVRAHRDDTGGTAIAPQREIFRDSLKRLRRLAAFVNFDGRSEQELYLLVRSLRDESRSALGG